MLFSKLLPKFVSFGVYPSARKIRITRTIHLNLMLLLHVVSTNIQCVLLLLEYTISLQET